MKHGQRLALSIILAAVSAPALAQAPDDRLRAAVAAIGLDMSAEAMIGHCEQAAPSAASGLRPKWRQWREDVLIQQVSSAIAPEKLAQVRDGMTSVATASVDKLKQMGPAERVCPDIAGWLKEGPFDMRGAYPAVYADLAEAGQAKASASAPRPNQATAPRTPAKTASAPGLDPALVQGLLYHGYGITGANGYEFREETLLLFKDGTAYFGDMASAELDVARSRQAEPNLWGRWRRKGDDFQMLRNDATGRPRGDWYDQSGRLIATWKPGQRLDATYTSKAFHGSLGLGGTYSSTSYSFSPDGRFEVIGFRRSGSGSVAAAGSGFVASGSGYSDGKGSRASAGGGSAGAFAGSQSRSDDGAGSRGVYRLDGLRLELKYDDGHTESVLCAPWSSDLKDIYMFGRTFSRG
ncbi:hypothetical protein PMI01_04632 [Caulobacter sp. AP07]|uniref:hypothetical protein n=1 Tax=Caulobacter sp. AP07 TaxID=1144304 RepID=UPI00027225A4|nr:hypothetical protein [Caulobacter sp. AP07]EJL24488.1 hypothetical protein PMI01_04632 [Caulobacter sp. AP07]